MFLRNTALSEFQQCPVGIAALYQFIEMLIVHEEGIKMLWSIINDTHKYIITKTKNCKRMLIPMTKKHDIWKTKVIHSKQRCKFYVNHLFVYFKIDLCSYIGYKLTKVLSFRTGVPMLPDLIDMKSTSCFWMFNFRQWIWTKYYLILPSSTVIYIIRYRSCKRYNWKLTQ